MLKSLVSLAIVTLCVASFAQASQLYRWVDANGRVSYSDQPPPANIKQVKTLSGKGNVIEVAKESYESKVAREKSPVTLYANACGPVCDQAQDLLKQRGVPFTLKDPSLTPEDAVEVKKLTGTLEVPVLLVGKTHLKGFEVSSWNSMLDNAGYPRTPLIPPKR
jgi:glutaredoxin